MATRSRNLKELPSPARAKEKALASPGRRGARGFPSRQDLHGATPQSIGATGDGNLHLCFLTYCGDIGVYGAPFNEGKGVCCRMFHGGRPNALFDFRRISKIRLIVKIFLSYFIPFFIFLIL